MDKKYIAIFAIVIVAIVACAAYFAFGSSSEGVIRIGHLPSDHDSAMYVAQAQKQYEKQGLTVKLTQFNNGGDLMTAIAAGEIDVGYVGITPALSSIEKGVPVKVVSGAQTEGTGLVAASNSSINSIADLKGKRVATPGAATIQNMLLTYALKEANVNSDDVSISSMKVAQMSDALKSGQIDAMITWEPYASLAVANGYGKLVENSSEILSGHPCCVVVATDNFIEKHPDELKKVLDIHENATKFIDENPKEAADLLPADIVPNKTIQADVIKNTNFISGLDDDFKQKVMDFMNLEVELGLLKEPINESKIFAEV